MAKFGLATQFQRSTYETKELGMNYLVAKRMKLDLLQVTSSSGRSKRQASNPRVTEIIDETCKKLTDDLRNLMACPLDTCDPSKKFREIGGCCNNLNNKEYGKGIFCSSIKINLV